MIEYETIPYDMNLLKKYSNQFKCGNDYVNNFIRSEKSLANWFGKTYVWIAQNHIIGFYNIGMGYLRNTSLPNYKEGGAVHLNYFAIDENYRHFIEVYTEGIKIKSSDWLMMDLLKRLEEIRNNSIGFSFVTLSSTYQGHNLYLRSDFTDIADDEDLFFDTKEEENGCIPMYYCMDENYI